MEKVLILIDSQNFRPQLLDFAASMVNGHGKTKITGVFLSGNPLAAAPGIRSVGGQIFVEEITMTEEEINQRKRDVEHSIALFKDACLQRELVAAVHNEDGNPLENIIKESRFADLIITDPSITFSGEKTIPSRFIKELLAKTECPVLIAPEYFDQVDEIVFAYDGSKSSVFAIKQFFYLMPSFADKKMVILHVVEPGKSQEEDPMRDTLFEEWLKMKCSRYSTVTIAGDSRDGLFNYFMDHSGDNNKLLITGAYGRGILSSFFRPSTADLVLKAIDIPVFISHL